MMIGTDFTVFCPDQMAPGPGRQCHTPPLRVLTADIFRHLGYSCSLYRLVCQKSKAFLALDTTILSCFRFGWWVLPTLQ